MFLCYEHSLAEDVSAIAKKDSSVALNTQSGAASSMNLSIADFRKIEPVYQKLAAVLESVDAAANAYRDAVSSGKKPLEMDAIRGFSARRNLAIAQSKMDLQNVLTPVGWQSLSAYIEGPFRETVRVFKKPQ